MLDTKKAELNYLNFLTDLVKLALKSGADSVDTIAVSSSSLNVSQRLGRKEDLERSESNNIGLRVFVGKKQAIVSSVISKNNDNQEIIERAISMAKVTPEDPFSSIVNKENLAKEWPDLNLLDEQEPSPDELYELASRAEDSALSNKEITNSEGAEASWSITTVALATSEGFKGAYSGSSFGISTSVIAGKDTEMERDYDYSISRHLSKIKSPEAIGQTAAKRTIQRLYPKKIKSTEIPIIFDWRVASSILGHFISAINGQSIARKTSFLKDKMGKQIFSKNVTIIDNPHIISGISSKPFDGEGSNCKLVELVTNGQLNSWILDTSSANQLNLVTTGHASRGISSPPSPSHSNLYMKPSKISVSELINSVDKCLFVTELIGMGVNSITGDYSRGASGLLISNGEVIHPVNEVTIAGNLNQIFSNIVPANDLKFRFGTNSPTLLVEGMTIAGT